MGVGKKRAVTQGATRAERRERAPRPIGRASERRVMRKELGELGRLVRGNLILSRVELESSHEPDLI